jgi:hypothetical protein
VARSLRRSADLGVRSLGQSWSVVALQCAALEVVDSLGTEAVPVQRVAAAFDELFAIA